MIGRPAWQRSSRIFPRVKLRERTDKQFPSACTLESIFIFLMEDFDPRRPTRRCTGGRPLRSSFELTGRIEEPEHPNARGQRRRREEVDEVSWI